MIDLWGVRSTPLLPLLLRPLWPGVVAPDRVLSMGKIELNHDISSLLVFTFKLRIYAKLKCLK